MPTANELPARSYEGVFLDSLPQVDRILGMLARRHALDHADAAEFGSWARARLIADDYAVYRKFQGRSSLPTYLAVVLANLYRDFRNAQWGRWRPTASAKRLGPLGIQLEALIVRDGHPAREAVAILRARGVEMPDGELLRMATSLPSRARVREVQLEHAQAQPAEGAADEGVSWVEGERERERLEGALRSSLGELPAEDQIIVRMHFWDGLTIADISRALRLDQRVLYRRIENMRRTLREGLERAGVNREAVGELVNRERRS